jgi:hypothetical protein
MLTLRPTGYCISTSLALGWLELVFPWSSLSARFSAIADRGRLVKNDLDQAAGESAFWHGCEQATLSGVCQRYFKDTKFCTHTLIDGYKICLLINFKLKIYRADTNKIVPVQIEMIVKLVVRVTVMFV